MFNVTSLIAERDEMQNELLVVSELMQQCINENAHTALDQTEYLERYNGLSERFEKVKAHLEVVTESIKDKQARQATIEAFLKELRQQNGLVTDFTPELWYSLVDFMTVYSKDDIRVTFKDGTKIRV